MTAAMHIVELPLFPLDTVLFPDGLLPLRIFEVRYLDMVRRCQQSQTPSAWSACDKDRRCSRPARRQRPSIGSAPWRA